MWFESESGLKEKGNQIATTMENDTTEIYTHTHTHTKDKELGALNRSDSASKT